MPQPPSSRRGAGRPPRHTSARKATTVVLPLELRAALEDIAQAEGLSRGDIMTRLLAEGLGQPVPPYCRPRNQQELPLDKAS